MSSCFISGITGQDGAYLAKFLIEKGYRVHGGVRRLSTGSTERLERLNILGEVQLHEFDLSEVQSLPRLIQSLELDEFYNLASQSFVGLSWETPIYTSEVNGMGVVRILDALRTLTPKTRFYQASTSEMFGVAQQVPQNEGTPLYPRCPYGAAKAFGHHATRNYRETLGMHASSGILFNHESPLRGVEFVTRKVTLALARLARGGRDPCLLGNLDARRDWGFAGDYVEGMWRMLQQPKGDEYVLATGVTTSVREFVNFAASALGMSLAWEGEGATERAIDILSGKCVVAVSKEFFRPAESDPLVGDATKARRILGWRPKVDVRRLAEIMVRADYDLVAREQREERRPGVADLV